MNTFKNGFRMMGSLIIAAIISVFLTFSMNVICSALFTKEIGYTAYVYENETATESMVQYEYLYTDDNGDGKDDGQDTKIEEYESQGYIVNTQKMRSTLEGKGKAVFLVVTQIFAFIMVVAFASSLPYKQGFKDANLVKTGHLKRDVLKGVKIGLIGNVPFFVLAVLLVVFAAGIAPGFRTIWYAFLSGHFYSFIVWTVGTAQSVADLSLIQYIIIFAMQFIVPVISGIAYILGFKEINLAEKIVYKKEV